jgi:hypothetical protein
MDIPTAQQNGASQRLRRNLTYEQGVIKDHTGLDALPGYVLVIFEKRDRGSAIFKRLVKPNEIFGAGFLDRLFDWSSQKYFSIAVNKADLTYNFDHVVALDDRSDKFKLNFRLTFRVSDPQRVAEMREHDPLRQLSEETAHLIGRNCARRKAEMFRGNKFRDLERIVINDESMKLRPFATERGLKILSIDLEKPLSVGEEGIITTRGEAETGKEIDKIKREQETSARAWERMTEKDVLGHKFDMRELELDRQILLSSRLDEAQQGDLRRLRRESETKAYRTAVEHLGESINNPNDALEMTDMVTTIGLRFGSGPLLEPAPVSNQPLIGAGEDRVAGFLNDALRHIDQWNCPRATKQELRSTIFHLVSEAMLDDHADEKILKQYGNKLSEIARGFQPPMNRNQRHFLEQFLNVGELRDRLR